MDIKTREQAVAFLNLLGVNPTEAAGSVDKADALVLLAAGKTIPQPGDDKKTKGGAK